MNTEIKINLSNIKKCNQVWAEMPINEKGRLCSKCNNTIIDFRNLTNSEIAQVHVFSEQKVCGLYNKQQLRKPRREIKKSKLNKWNSLYFTLFSFLSFNSLGQEKIETVKIEQTENKFEKINKSDQNENNETQSIAVEHILISGKITDEDGEPLPFVNVSIIETKSGVTTDFDGLYTLDISDLLVYHNKLTLKFSYIGYESIEKEIDSNFVKEEKNRTINLKLKTNELTVFRVYEKAPFHKRIWNRVKNIFRKK